MLSRATQTPQMLARLDAAIDELQRSGEFRRIAAFYALPVLINQTLDSEWFRVLAFIGTSAFALSGVVLAYAGQYSLFGALILASLPRLAVASCAICCCSETRWESYAIPRHC